MKVSYTCLHPQYFEATLNQSKLIEIRLGKNKSAPYKKVYSGDIIYFAETKNKRILQCICSKVEYYDIIDSELIEYIFLFFPKSNQYIQNKINTAKYCSIIHVRCPQLVEISHPRPQGWLIR